MSRRFPEALAVSLVISFGLLVGPSHAADLSCLPPEAGQTVSKLVEAGDLARIVPADWSFRSADIDRDHLRIEFEPVPGETLAIELSHLGEAGGQAHGRWFVFAPTADPGPLEDAQRQILVKVAASVDAAFDQSPWMSCGPAILDDASIPRALATHWWWMMAGAALGLVLAGLLAREHSAAALARAGAWIDAHPWPLLVALLIPLFAIRIVHLNIPFDGDYASQRIFFGSLDLGDILAHHYDDARHPQLYYLVLHFFLGFGHEEWIARLPAVLFSLTTAVGLFVFTRPLLGGLRALVAVALLGLSAPFLYHSRDVSDVTLFLTLALVSSHLLLRYLRHPSAGLAVGLCLAEIAMLYSYYMAILVAAAHLVVLLVHARSARLWPIWLAAGLAALVSLPALIDLGLVFLGDQGVRQVAANFPQHVWGDRQPLEFFAELAGLLAPAGPPGILWGILALGGAVGWWHAHRWRPAGLLLVVLFGLAACVAAVGVFTVRLKPYYLIYLLPLVGLLVTAGGLGVGPSERPGKGSLGRLLRRVALVALCAAVAGQAADIKRSMPTLLVARYHAMFEQLAQAVERNGGLDTVIADPNSMHTILLYYLFEDPLRAYRTCVRGPSGATCCRYAGRRLITLTALPGMRPGWQMASLASLSRYEDRPFWFVYSSRFENRPLLEHLLHACRDEGSWEHLRLFRCEPAGRLPVGGGEGAGPPAGALPQAGDRQADQAVEVEEPGRQQVVNRQGDVGAAP